MARYLVAASVSGLEAAICLNKADLEVNKEVLDELELWKSLNIEVLETSTKTGQGIDSLVDFLTKAQCSGSPVELGWPIGGRQDIFGQ